MTFTIAHVNVARGYRGGERQTELLIRALARHDVRQFLVARRRQPLAQRAADAGVEVRPVSGGPLSVVPALAGADLVHVHEGRSVYAAWLRAVLHGTPYILTRRVDNPIGEHWAAHKAYRAAACIAAVAPQVADIVRRYDGTVPVEVIHDASSGFHADPERAASIRAQHPGKLLVGHVAALDNRQKGQEHILAAARMLSESRPDVQFLLVGAGDDEAMLKRAAAGLGNVTFVGFVDNVGDYLAAFDLFILPSNREGLGSILVDAMEQGLAVVASAVGGVPSIVRDGENGILIPPASPAELAAAILRLCADPELRRRLGERGRELAKGFTAESMCAKYLALYRRVLGVPA
ncbi:MAG TPA: glycosyltransferase family 4 protein [Gammaproteobacteria bacterium]